MNLSSILHNFVVFEGIDGAGKSTQIKLVTDALKEKKLSISSTREPYNGIMGHTVRNILNNHIHELESPYTSDFASIILSYLFAADRHEHLYTKNGIIHSLKNYDIVISDRYLFSSIAYQGEGEANNLTIKLNKEFPLPKIVIYFDIPPEYSMQRMKHKQKDGLETLSNLQRVHARYTKTLTQYAEKYPEINILYINALETQNILCTKISNYIINTLNLN